MKGPVPRNTVAQLGLVPEKQVRHELLRRLHLGDVQFACRLTRSRTVIVLEYAGSEFSFVYSNSTKEILRFLAPDAPETKSWRKSKLGPDEAA